VLLAVDAHTGRRYLVDAEAHKQMRAPQLKDKILEWSDRYPIYEWRVEANGVQRNLVQYNEDIIQPLAARGIKVSGHVTNQNKWDPQFGVETLAPLFGAKMIDIPMSAQGSDMEELIRQFKNFPLMPVSDLVMATWFAEIGAREIVTRPSLPLFSERTGHWPERIRKRRRLIDVHSGKVTPIPLSQQNSRFLTGADRRRLTVGRPTLYPDLVEGPGRNLKPLVNRDGFIDVGETEGDGDAPSGGTPSTG